ncbi:Detected protein of unknown function [Hibiscus syriacus]|uniref:Uncharacterized protein n=1 Tax=Hibiscus syriacus TaxID=106335 RepID=A0A6A3BDT1_HIBSY|nr:Detected protein of unknown function [Hibiscus syriacus]
MSTSSCSNWLLSYRKLKFFTRTHRTKNNNDKAEDRQLVKEKETDLDGSAVLQKTVKRLNFGSWEEKEMAAIAIEKLVREDDMASGRPQSGPIKALIELANETFTNEALMLEAGILSKLPKDINVVDEQTRHDLQNCYHHYLLHQYPFRKCWTFGSNGVVHTLLKLSSCNDLSEKTLAALGHLVVTLIGKRAMEDSSMVPESLIEILTWEDKPKCQESSAYILMILAHQSSTQRDKMSNAGIVPWFKDERQAKMGPHSGPQTGRVAMGSPLHTKEGQEGKKMMSLVKQSLDKNMEIITRRANGGAGGVHSSTINSLLLTTTSKSFTF